MTQIWKGIKEAKSKLDQVDTKYMKNAKVSLETEDNAKYMTARTWKERVGGKKYSRKEGNTERNEYIVEKEGRMLGLKIEVK